MRIENTIILFYLALIWLVSNHIKHYFAKYIHAGDTIQLHNCYNVRYIGIDAPEIDRKDDVMEFMALKLAKKFEKIWLEKNLVRVLFTTEVVESSIIIK